MNRPLPGVYAVRVRRLLATFFLLVVGCDGRVATPVAHDAGWRPSRTDAAIAPDGAPPPPPDDGTVALDETPEVDPLPPVMGGSLLVAADRIVAADPDRATIWVLDHLAPRVVGRIDLDATDVPGRMVADGDGIAHVVLRGSGQVLDLDVIDASILRRRPACAAPRGIDWDPVRDLLVVACAGGEIVGLAPGGGDAMLLTRLAPDLRDVVVGDGVVFVSRFRSAELLELDPISYALERIRRAPPELSGAAQVAWRLRRIPSGVAMLHQRARTDRVAVERSGYSGGVDCDVGITAPAISLFVKRAADVCVPVTDGQPCVDETLEGGGPISGATLAVDFAVHAADSIAYLALAESNASSAMRPDPSTYLMLGELHSPCVRARDGGPTAPRPVIAVEALPDGAQVTVHRNPFEVIVQGGARFRGRRLDDGLGHDLFHAATTSGVACASCHPEGHEDGHVWQLGGAPRRTQSVLGGVISSVPFHWSGDVSDLSEIMRIGFVERMGGRLVVPDEVAALGRWLDAQPALPGSPVDPSVAARGRALFEDATVGCDGCHTTPRAENVDVGTGGAFQVPMLSGVALRAPYLHHGCAATLRDVVDGACASSDAHGVTSHLDEAARSDLAAYLSSL